MQNFNQNFDHVFKAR